MIIAYAFISYLAISFTAIDGIQFLYIIKYVTLGYSDCFVLTNPLFLISMMDPRSVADDIDIDGGDHDQSVHVASVDEQVAEIQHLLREGVEKCRTGLAESQTRDEERNKRRMEKDEQYAALRESLENAKETLERRRSEQQESETAGSWSFNCARDAKDIIWIYRCVRNLTPHHRGESSRPAWYN